MPKAIRTDNGVPLASDRRVTYGTCFPPETLAACWCVAQGYITSQKSQIARRQFSCCKKIRPTIDLSATEWTILTVSVERPISSFEF
jgi:hypothetical protein